nr:MAG TPA: hypothetical protein [Caudoviricetes sp.]
MLEHYLQKYKIVTVLNIRDINLTLQKDSYYQKRYLV